MTAREYPARVRARIESRDAALINLGYRDYDHYLHSPEWQAIRVRHRTKYGEACGLCEIAKGRRQLHHMTYERVGQEELHDLVLLCAKCHRMIHILEQRGDIGLDFAGLADFKRAAKYATEQEARRELARSERRDAMQSAERLTMAASSFRAELGRKIRQMPTSAALDLIGQMETLLREAEANERAALK